MTNKWPRLSEWGGEMTEIIPGTLCLIIKGGYTGESVTAVRVVTNKEVANAIYKATGVKGTISYPHASWEIDKPLLFWGS